MRSILNTRRDFIRKASAGIAAISLPSILYAGVAICYKSMFKSASSRKIIAKMPFLNVRVSIFSFSVSKLK